MAVDDFFDPERKYNRKQYAYNGGDKSRFHTLQKHIDALFCIVHIELIQRIRDPEKGSEYSQGSKQTWEKL